MPEIALILSFICFGIVSLTLFLFMQEGFFTLKRWYLFSFVVFIFLITWYIIAYTTRPISFTTNVPISKIHSVNGNIVYGIALPSGKIINLNQKMNVNFSENDVVK